MAFPYFYSNASFRKFLPGVNAHLIKWYVTGGFLTARVFVMARFWIYAAFRPRDSIRVSSNGGIQFLAGTIGRYHALIRQLHFLIVDSMACFLIYPNQGATVINGGVI